MRALRSPSLVLALTMAVASLGAGGSALAQTVEESEQAAEEAEGRAEVAAGLVDAAVAERIEIETELATSLARISDLSAQLSRVSSSLDTLRSQIGFADAELSGIETDLETHAVDAYMTALVTPGVTFVNSESVEEAMVAGQVVEDVVNSGKARVDELVIKRGALEDLRTAFKAQQEQVAAIKADVDAEIDHLTELYQQADRAVAEAITEANAADAAYRDALSAVEAAQAREAERNRQEERDAPTVTPEPEDGSPTTTSPPAPSTTIGDDGGGGGGSWDFPPAVERWRSTAEAYFPASRVDQALRIIQCESLGDPDAYNPYSGASGLFQFLPATWASTAPKAGFPGASVFDPSANIGTAAWMANRYQELGLGYWAPWSCRRVLG
ncbi:MAG TPA: transglycosylase SLT domain-containing protein [Acidimicrobiia bacterium]|jgi:septal ring factor EnvC (AmiA/AmiB activator)